jgi:hypothetical protein
MVGTLTIVIGLCGSGKSWFLNTMQKSHPVAKFFDEGLSDRGQSGIDRRKKVAIALKNGFDVYVGDLWCGWSARRRVVVKHLKQLVPKLRIVWFYYENSLCKANNNCRKRRNKRDAKGHVAINQRWSSRLTAPRGAIVMKIHQLGRK